MPVLLEALEPRRLLATYYVENTGDSAILGSGSLRAAILAADADNSPGTDQIAFDIPAGEPADLAVPVPGFDPSTQDWTITLASPLPPITRTVSIDGYTEGAGGGEPFLYPSSISSAVQSLSIVGSPTGGSFTLSTSSPLPAGTTAALPFTADAGTVQDALEAIIGAGNVAVTGGPLPAASLSITYQGAYADEAIPDLTATSSLTGGNSPSVAVATSTIGGVAGIPTFISSVPNSVAALTGNTAQVRVIISGNNIPSSPTDIGFEIDASNSILRGLAIDGFDVGVVVPDPSNVGTLIQGNFIGEYATYLVDTQTGVALSTDPVALAGFGNTKQGVVLYSDNTTLGGVEPQDENVIAGNGAQAVLLEPGALGNQVLGNEIGVIGPFGTIADYYFDPGNGGDGVSIESLVIPGDQASFVYTSSNTVGGAVSGAGNVISSNSGEGVDIDGVGATENLVEANYIGAPPNGGYAFGSGNPGNHADGVLINDAPDNQVGGSVTSDGNVISANGAAGVDVSGVDATGNTVLNNIIGLTADGISALGNDQAGVYDTAPGTVIGPGNVISANLAGVLISGATAAGVTVTDNLIGTDSSGEADLGNAKVGVDIENTTGVIVEGNGQGSQVISGNQIGVEIDGASSTQNLVEGNFIGVDLTGTADRGNSGDGVLIEGASGNTVGGTTAAARNVISANYWGIDVDGLASTGNLVEGNDIGTDLTGTLPLGNEVYGIIFSTTAWNNIVGGTAAGQANTIAFNVATGVIVQSGIGDSVLSNSIYSNGQQGIVLVGTANNAQSAPSLSGATGGGEGSNIEGSLTSIAGTTFLIQFFSSLVADPSGFGQGQTFLGSTTVTTTAGGTASIDFNLLSGIAVGAWVTALATNESTGDTSAFSNAIPAQAANVAFSAASYTVASTAGMATIDVVRTGNLNVAVSVVYATSNGSAIAGQDYTSVTGTLTFAPGVTEESFSVPILNNTHRSTNVSTLNLTLSQPGGGATLGAISSATLTITNSNQNVSTFVVTNTGDSGPGSLRAAIEAANADPNPGVDNIVFDIPASTAADLNVPVSGFDPSTQTWTITLDSPLPVITHSVAINGYTQANVGVPFVYPANITSAVQFVGVSATGGSFTLTTSAPLPADQTTQAIPYNATAAQVQAALAAIVGQNNVAVTGGPVDSGGVIITFQGMYGQEAIPDLIATSNLTGINPTATVQTTTVGGIIEGTTLITSVPNSTAATDGNNAQVRVIINGGNLTSGPADIGLELNASDSILRGLAIEGFTVGVSVPNITDVGDLIQGNFIGEYLAYPVDPATGVALPSTDTVELAGQGNTQQGVVLGSRNATLGGTDPEESNVIAGNGSQGVLVEPGASGNQVLGNQIGVAGPSSSGSYFPAGNGADGILIESSGSASDPSTIVYASSNIIGGAVAGAGNVISDNLSYGVHIEGVGATRNLVEANYIGLAPGGDVFGSGDPGNHADGVSIDDAPDNQVGGAASSDGNVISSNAGNGVNITGTDALGNTVLDNIIGLTAAGTAVLGNDQAGVADTAPGTVIGPGNVISANLIGVLISGATATDVTVTGNLIGTDSTGEADLGNAEDGVEIDSATGVIVEGNGQGSQVISGNLVGVAINGPSATGNLVEGNYIGTDKSGAADRGNANEGVLIEAASGNTVGGTTAAARNVISANQWGIRLDGSSANGNLIAGNDIGTDTTGMLPLGNEINGIVISANASNNTIGGTANGQGNTIAFNVAAGVNVQSGTGDSILSNSIYSNDQGILLDAANAANDSINTPTLFTAIPNAKAQTISIQGSYTSLPNASFLIQFFSNLAADPSGYYEGQIYLGSTIVTTTAGGQVSFAASLSTVNDPSTVVDSSSWITATSTSLTNIVPGLSLGDSSEFSLATVSQAVGVGFATASITVDSTAGTVAVEVDRTGNANAVVSVNYATSNGTAIAGTNYVAASGILTFQAGQDEESFSITILPSSSQIASATTVNMALSQPAGGATLGPIVTAVLTINETPGPPPPPLDTTAPDVTSEQLIVTGRAITALTLTFSKELNATRAVDLSNYGYYVFSQGNRYTAGATYTSLSSAVYNSATNTVTLYPISPLPLNKFFEITIDGQASPLLNNGLVDLEGNQLTGSTGARGTPLVLNFAAGNKLSYIDGGNNAVSLQLTKGGVMEMFISPLGVVEQLQLAGTVPRKSTLNGSVRRLRGGTGRAVLPSIAGAAGVRIRLKTPPFTFRASPPIDAKTAGQFAAHRS